MEELVRAEEIHRDEDTRGGGGGSAAPNGALQLPPPTGPPRPWPGGRPRTLPHRHGLGPPPAGPCRVTAATAAVCDLQPPWGGPHMRLCSH